jgi:hypothetical protein
MEINIEVIKMKELGMNLEPRLLLTDCRAGQSVQEKIEETGAEQKDGEELIDDLLKDEDEDFV